MKTFQSFQLEVPEEYLPETMKRSFPLFLEIDYCVENKNPLLVFKIAAITSLITELNWKTGIMQHIDNMANKHYNNLINSASHELQPEN